MGTTRILCFIALISSAAALCEYYLHFNLCLLDFLLKYHLFIALLGIVHSSFSQLHHTQGYN